MADDVSKRFSIISEDDGTTFIATFADGSPLVTDGYGGWQVINRPRKLGVVEWQGRNPIAIEIPFIIDFWLAAIVNPGVHCEGKVAKLEKLCGFGTNRQPPVCKVQSQGVIPHDLTNNKTMRWVIESVTWDRDLELRNNRTGKRLRCGGTIQIRQFTTARDILHKIKPNARARKPRVYIVKKGDTLSKIAKHYYHDPHKWKIIADANKLRDRRSIHRGDHLKVPWI